MKSIIYIVLAAILFGIVVSACPKTISNQKQVVTIQCVDERSDTNLLHGSCLIISNRLKEYGVQNFEISANADQNTIDIAFAGKVDVNEIAQLLTSKGKIEFYETYNRLDVMKLMEKEDKLFSLLNIPAEHSENYNSMAILGYCNLKNKSLVDSYIGSHYVSKPDEGIKFVWSESANRNGNYYLYLLKHQPAIDKSQISETAVVKRPEEANKFDLMINFNKNGTLVWQHLSKSNIGKQIAMVVDNKVYFAPKVMEEINSGKAMISGDFSGKEMIRLKSLIDNDVLPLEFKLK